MTLTTDHGSSNSPTTMGLIDLMTSLAIVFIMLFAALSTQASSGAQTQLQAHKEDVQEALRNHLGRFDLALDSDPQDPLTLLIVVPENRLTFEFARSTLSPQGEQFLKDAMPFYAAALCGPLRSKIDSLAIQGHTDDRGDDVYNLQLSQERSLAVMVRSLEVIQAQAPLAYECFQEMTSASGRGRQELVHDPNHQVNHEKSRRVIFKIRLRSTEQRSVPGLPLTRTASGPAVG